MVKKIINEYLFTTTAMLLLIGAVVLGTIAVIGLSVTASLFSLACAISGVYFLLFASMLGEI